MSAGWFSTLTGVKYASDIELGSGRNLGMCRVLYGGRMGARQLARGHCDRCGSGGGEMRSRALNAYLLLSVITIASCATVQQLAIKADMAYATSVFALDDAEFAACHGTPILLSASACADLDPRMAQALQDVQHVTQAVQLLPTRVPTDLSALLLDLNLIQSILGQLQQVPTVQSLAKQTVDANAKAIALLAKLTGAK